MAAPVSVVKTAITGGRVVTAAGECRADVLIEDGRVIAVGRDLPLEAERTFDASGRYVLPGCVDVHTHMDLAVVGNYNPDEEDAGEFAAESTADDFGTGTIAAAFGGTTTIVDFAEQAAGQTLLDGVDAWHEKLRRSAPSVDVGFHLIVRDLGPEPAAELGQLLAGGVTSLKLFMAYKGDLMVDDGTLWEAMGLAAEQGALVMVHAENGDVVDSLVGRARRAGQLEPRFHAASRPCGVEVEAVGRALELARMAGCPLYVVHVSCAGSAELVEAARGDRDGVFAETCTQYLLCDESDLQRPDFEGAKFVFTPPPRRAADRERLWRALATDTLSVVSSDHSPATFEARKRLGGEDFSKIPNGSGGVEERLMLVHHHGVNAGRISLPRMVEVLASNPARLLGMYPRKGTIAPGSDADIVIFDPDRELRLGVDVLHSNCDHSIYEGEVVRGVPETVLLRGEPLVVDGRLQGAGRGEFVPRQQPRRYVATDATSAAPALG